MAKHDHNAICRIFGEFVIYRPKGNRFIVGYMPMTLQKGDYIFGRL